MSTLSDYLNAHLPTGWQKSQLVDALSGTIDRATVYRYLSGNHPRSPGEFVLQAFAAVLQDATLTELRAAANLSVGAEDPWIPPVEANRLSTPQRRALDAFIKATVNAGRGEDHGEGSGHTAATEAAAATDLAPEDQADVQTYVDRLYASGRRNLADRIAAALVMSSASETANRSAND